MSTYLLEITLWSIPHTLVYRGYLGVLWDHSINFKYVVPLQSNDNGWHAFSVNHQVLCQPLWLVCQL